MIFAIWIIIWLQSAQEPLELILPLSAIILRAVYLDREFPKIKTQFWVIWILLALLTANSQGVTYSITLLGKIIISFILFTHLINQINYSQLKKFKPLHNLWFLTSRAMILIKERGLDINYWLTVRSKLLYGSKFRRFLKGGYWRLLARAVLAYIIELLFIRRKLNVLINSRGKFPENYDWHFDYTPKNAVWFVLIGDVIVFFSMIGLALFNPELLIPENLLTRIVGK